MKIVQSAYRYWPSMGGVEEYVQQLSERVARQADVTVVTTNIKNHWDRSTLDVLARECVGGVEVLRCPLSSLSLSSYPLSWSMASTLWRQKSDIYHGHSFMFPSADYAALVARCKGRPFVFNPYLADEGPPSLLGKLYRKTMGKLLMKADVVVVISPYERCLLDVWGYSQVRRIEEISPGIDIAEFEQVDHNAWDDLGVQGVVRLFTAGRIDENKGLDVMVQALPRIVQYSKDIRWVIAGPDFGYQKTLEQMIASLNLEPYVTFVGAVLRKDLCSYYTHADVFVFPTRFEAFGIVAAEAMAAQTPVVATRTASLPYVVQDETTGLLFEKDRANDLADKVLDLVKDESLRSAMGQAGREHVKRHYDWNQAAEHLFHVYQSLR